MPLEFEQTNEQKTRVTIGATTPGGRPAPVQDLAVTVSSGAGTVETTDNPNSVFLVSSDEPGDTVYLVNADADLGEGVVPISDAITMHIKGAQASAFTFGIGETVPK